MVSLYLYDDFIYYKNPIDGFFTKLMELKNNAINAKKGVWIYTTETKQAGRTKELVEGQGTRKVLQFKGVAAPIFIL
jgi:hypothetical protein